MKRMSEMMGKTLQRAKDKAVKKPPHEHAATVDLIQNAGLVKGKYNYKYWLGKIHSAGVDYNQMVGILKEIQSMDPKYNKGGRLTNLLTEKSKQKKK